MEKAENKERFPLFHSKCRCCYGWKCAHFQLLAPKSPTKKPEAPQK
jgi:hypothetical protein